jgi:hypothetical protein
VSRGITPAQALASVEPTFALSAARPRPVRAGRAAIVKVTLTNTGAAAKKAVKVCLNARPGLSPRRSCKVVKAPPARSRRVLSFRLGTTKRTRAGSYRLSVVAAGTGAKSKTLVLKVVK